MPVSSLLIYSLVLSKAIFHFNTSQSAPVINLGLIQKYVALHESETDKKILLRTADVNDWIKYKKARNKVNNLRKHAKEIFYNNLELFLSDFHKNDKKKIWQIIRHFVKNNNNVIFLPLLSQREVSPVTASQMKKKLNALITISPL